MSAEIIIRIVCEHKNVDPERVFTADRHQNVMFARFAIWHHLHYSCNLSATRLAHMFGKSRRNIFRGIHVFKHHLRYNKDIRDDYEALAKKLEGVTEAAPSGNMGEKN